MPSTTRVLGRQDVMPDFSTSLLTKQASLRVNCLKSLTANSAGNIRNSYQSKLLN